VIKALYYSGLISTTLAAAVLLLLTAIVVGSRRNSSEPGRITRSVVNLLGSWYVLAFVALGTLVNTGYGLYKGYVVPRDYMQDVISAREFLAGKSLYPGDMTKKFQDMIALTPPTRSLWPEGSSRREEERVGRIKASSSPWVQAHPPVMTLFFAPLVRLFGVYGTFVAISILSVASLIIAPIVIARTMGLSLSRVALATLALGILGWSATIEDLRDGQSGPYLMLLCVLGWSFLRTGRPVLAGLTIGVATSLKLFPGIILVYFLLKDRRAFLSAISVIAAGALLSVILCGPRVFLEFLQTARFVSDYYSHYSSNISLLASLLRIVGGEEREGAARVIWFTFGVASVFAATLAARMSRTDDPDPSRSIDLGYSFFMLPLATLAQSVFRADASDGSKIAFFVLVAVMATPFNTFAFARSLMNARVDDYLLRVTLLNIRTVSILALAGWLAWRYALERGVFLRLAAHGSRVPAPEIKQP
jgi:hypothetical protein